MPLSYSALGSSLASDWLVAEGGENPASPTESGERFAGAVASWFGQATAGGFPCSTASARRSQLAAGAGGAFGANDANLAGAQLAIALMGYMAGQLFGAGVASPPTAVGAAQAAFTATFLDLDPANWPRADRIAAGVHTLAISTIVVFPPPIGAPSPVT